MAGRVRRGVEVDRDHRTEDQCDRDDPAERDTAQDDLHEHPDGEADGIEEPVPALDVLLIAHATCFTVRHRGRAAYRRRRLYVGQALPRWRLWEGRLCRARPEHGCSGRASALVLSHDGLPARCPCRAGRRRGCGRLPVRGFRTPTVSMQHADLPSPADERSRLPSVRFSDQHGGGGLDHGGDSAPSLDLHRWPRPGRIACRSANRTHGQRGTTPPSWPSAVHVGSVARP